jgi:flagellar assembly protein FliH
MGNKDKMGNDGAAMRKYMFDVDFGPPSAAHAAAAVAAALDDDENEPLVAAEDLPPPPTFSEEELQLARESAFEEGRQAGLAEAADMSERMLASAMAGIAGGVEILKAQQEELGDVHVRTAVRVAMAVLKKVLPGACEKYAFEEVARVVEECIGHVLDEPRIVVRVSADLTDPIRDRLEAIAADQGFQGRVVVQADARLSPGDCRVEWTDGGAERDQARLVRDVEDAVERSLAPPDHPAGE